LNSQLKAKSNYNYFYKFRIKVARATTFINELWKGKLIIEDEKNRDIAWFLDSKESWKVWQTATDLVHN
jgi:hypothetical protein